MASKILSFCSSNKVLYNVLIVVLLKIQTLNVIQSSFILVRYKWFFIFGILTYLINDKLLNLLKLVLLYILLYKPSNS